MERISRQARQIRMVDQRPARTRLGLLSVLGTALIFAALAGCGSVVAPSGAAGAPLATATTAARVGCASVNQATAVSIRRDIRLEVPTGTNPIGSGVYRQVAQVRALFGQMCAAVTHPARTMVMRCPADMGTGFFGAFYDGSRVLATFTFAPAVCERVSVTAAGRTLATAVSGPAAAAAPHLAADLAAIMGTAKPQGTINPGGPNKPA
jgi:hypothetical protein